MSLEILNNTLGVSSLNDTLGENSSDSEILEVKNLSNNSFSNFSKNISNEYATSSPFGEKSLFYKKNISGVAYNMLISNSIWKYEIITSTKGTELIERYTKYDEKIDLSKGKYDDDTDLIIYIEESSTINGYLIDTNDICLIRMSQQMLNEYFAIIKSNPQSTILEDWSNFILQQQKNVNNISFTQEKLIEAFKMEIAYRPLKNISVGNSKYTQTEFTNTILDGFSEAFRKLKTDKETWDAALNSDKYFLKNSGKVFGFFKDQLNNAAEILKTVETTLTFFEFIIPTEKPFFKSLKLFINSFQASLHALEIQINTIEKSSPYLFAFICGLWDGTIEFFAGFLDMILIVVKLYFQLNDLNTEDKLVYSKLKEAIIEFIENYIQDPDFLQKAFANALSEYLEERYSNAENGYVIAHNGGEDLIIILDIIVSVVEVVKSLADAGKVLPKFENWVDEAFERNRSLEKKLDEIKTPERVLEKSIDEIISDSEKKQSPKARVKEKRKNQQKKVEKRNSKKIRERDLKIYLEHREELLKLSKKDLLDLWRKDIDLRNLQKIDLKNFYNQMIKKYPELISNNFAIFKTVIYKEGKVIEEIIEFSHSGPKKLYDNFLDVVVDPKFKNGLEDFDKIKRRNDSEVKYIFNFLQNHAYKGDYFIIESTNIFVACDSCKREFVTLKKLFGDKIKIRIKSVDHITGTHDLDNFLNK